MARNHNDNLPLSPHNEMNPGHDTPAAGNSYDVKSFPRLFGELIGKRIGTTHNDSKHFGCLVRYATAEEFQVEILVQRTFTDPNYNPEIPLRTSGVVALTMRYEGRIDGIDRFILKGLESRTWTVGLNRYGDVIRQREQCPHYDIGIFGVSEETLRNDYGKFFRIADAEAVDGRADLPQREEMNRSDWLALTCQCR